MDIQELTHRAQEHGKTLTAPRKAVFDVLKSADKVLTAYDILDRMRGDVKPMTVYRALDFLTEIGAAHRIESLNAYITCRESHCAHTDSQYMICSTCGRAEEIHNHDLDHKINHTLSNRGFTVKKIALEALGTCGECRSHAL